MMSLVSFLVGGACFFVGWRLELLAAWSVFRGSRLEFGAPSCYFAIDEAMLPAVLSNSWADWSELVTCFWSLFDVLSASLLAF